MARLKAKTSPTGYLVETKNGENIVEYPVARFDEQGYAMIADLTLGMLVRATDLPDYDQTVPMWQVQR